jgi:selenocysteine-specific elongation factor
VLRAENASATLGGGVVVEVLDRRLPRRRQGLVEELLRQSERLGEADALVEAHLRAAGDAGTRLAETAARTALRPESIPAVVARLVQAGIAVRLGHDGALWIAKEGFDRVLERVEAGARRLHEKDPALAALPASAIRSAAGRVAPAVLDAAMDALLEDGRLRREPAGGLRHRSHAPQLSVQDSEQLRRVQQALAAGRGQPPGSEDLEADLALSRQEVGRLLKLLVNRGLAFRAGDLYFDAAWIEDAKGRLAAHARLHGGFTPSDARTVLDTTRKWVIPLLEALDKAGFSRRTGDRRVVR